MLWNRWIPEHFYVLREIIPAAKLPAADQAQVYKKVHKTKTICRIIYKMHKNNVDNFSLQTLI
jgi:hypothetical protein